VNDREIAYVIRDSVPFRSRAGVTAWLLAIDVMLASKKSTASKVPLSGLKSTGIYPHGWEDRGSVKWRLAAMEPSFWHALAFPPLVFG
jgi:hypothetical protein